MTRRRWVQIDGELVPVSDDFIAEPRAQVAHVRGDLPDFVSPIDHKVYSGRAGLREHCKIHDVVPTADLKGLPPKLSATAPKIDRKEIKQTIADIINSRGY